MTKKKADMTPEECARVRAQALAWCQANRDKINAKQQAKRRPSVEARAAELAATEEQRSADKALRDASRMKAWAQRNSAHVKAKRRAAYAANKPKSVAKAVAWNRINVGRRRAINASYSAANPDQRRAIKARRRARERGAEGSYSKQDVADLLERQGWKCAGCGTCLRLAGYEVDHVQALVRGGSNYPSNLQALCMTCNRRKGAKDNRAFLLELKSERYVAAPG